MASSGSLALLASDFQALGSETKRKHADIKEVSSVHSSFFSFWMLAPCWTLVESFFAAFQSI
jgi:hypothetical protein